MKLIITAGGTSEALDDVRRITNRATGRLGSLIAEEVSLQREAAGRSGEPLKIYYVCEEGAVQPRISCLEVVHTAGATNLKAALEDILRREPIDAVVHSMAVSDYAPDSVTTADALIRSAAKKLAASGEKPGEAQVRAALRQALREEGAFSGKGKLSSDADGLLVTFRRTPKVISVFKAMQPGMLLFGFKLLSGVTRQALFEAGLGILRRNRCDYVLATDAESLAGGGQTGYLLAPDGSFQELDGKPAIARRIAQLIWEKRAGSSTAK